MVNQSTTHLSKISKRKFYLIDQENYLDIIDLNQVGALWLEQISISRSLSGFLFTCKNV